MSGDLVITITVSSKAAKPYVKAYQNEGYDTVVDTRSMEWEDLSKVLVAINLPLQNKISNIRSEAARNIRDSIKRIETDQARLVGLRQELAELTEEE